MEYFSVTGMSCAACSARVERAVKKLDGVKECNVSLLTNSMGVEGTASSQEIIKAVTDAGYGASLKVTEKTKEKVNHSAEEEALLDKETPILKKRLISSVIFLIPLMYVSMGHMMWNFPLPSWFNENHVAMGLVQLLLTAIIMVINQKFFISGFKSLFNKAPNMDSLVALGSAASFVWSVYVLFAMTKAVVDGNKDAVMEYMMNFYFESAAMILTLITVGKMLEARSKGKTTDALKSLMNLAPKTAVIIKDNKEISVGVEEVQVGDIFVVRPGEDIPVDAEILEGHTAINEASLTGESIPVDKKVGDSVSAGTLNQTGFITCRATRVGNDTTLSQIIKMVSEAAATKAPVAKVADTVSGIFVPVVIGISVLTTIIWIFAGKDFGFALARGISVLVISCPCALGLATPVAIMVGNGLGAKNGILFKTALSLEETGKVKTVALDKTGTITKGEPVALDVIPSENGNEQELLEVAYSLESKSEHPLAKAVSSLGMQKKVALAEVTEFSTVTGSGLTALINGTKCFGGNKNFIESNISLQNSDSEKTLFKKAELLSEQGKTPLFFAKENKMLGIISVSDTIKEDSKQAISSLKKLGIKTVMLTGDNERTANAVAKEAGVDEVIAGVLPDGKENVIRELQKTAKTCMIGDGINDAPALTRANIGIAIGAGTDVALDAADVVLMKSSLLDAVKAIRLSRATLKNIHQNLFWAFIYNVIGIPLAAGVLIPLFNIKLNPMFAAAAMSLSSFSVVTNALRLNFTKLQE